MHLLRSFDYPKPSIQTSRTLVSGTEGGGNRTLGRIWGLLLLLVFEECTTLSESISVDNFFSIQLGRSFEEGFQGWGRDFGDGRHVYTVVWLRTGTTTTSALRTFRDEGLGALLDDRSLIHSERCLIARDIISRKESHSVHETNRRKGERTLKSVWHYAARDHLSLHRCQRAPSTDSHRSTTFQIRGKKPPSSIPSSIPP
ncbi:hypothetical protein BGZ57DRAFT_279642 [Hyaloscypha finlandica]|nr:hypothetical protein BGZ57DRAFT_279642 [Hyaloscypha finlandica]